MRKLLFALATTGLTTLAAFGQGAVFIDNSNARGYLDHLVNGVAYSGPFGLEVWYKNADRPDSDINSWNGDGYSTAYDMLTSHGFSLATHKANAGTASGGIFSAGEVDIKAPGGSFPAGQAGPGLDRTLYGGNVLLALAMWEGTGSYFGSGPRGVVTFVTPTSDWTIPPPLTPIPPSTDNFGFDGACTDLILAISPEPSVFALVGLGAAMLLVAQKRRQPLKA